MKLHGNSNSSISGRTARLPGSWPKKAHLRHKKKARGERDGSEAEGGVQMAECEQGFMSSSRACRTYLHDTPYFPLDLLDESFNQLSSIAECSHLSSRSLELTVKDLGDAFEISEDSPNVRSTRREGGRWF